MHRLALRPRWGIGLALLAVTVVFFVAALPPAHTALAVSVPHDPLWVHALPCLFYGMAVGLPVLLAIRLLDRGSAHAPWMAAAAGGLSGNLVLQLHCPITLSSHNLAGHATVAAVFLFALLVERRLRGGAYENGRTHRGVPFNSRRCRRGDRRRGNRCSRDRCRRRGLRGVRRAGSAADSRRGSRAFGGEAAPLAVSAPACPSADVSSSVRLRRSEANGERSR